MELAEPLDSSERLLLFEELVNQVNTVGIRGVGHQSVAVGISKRHVRIVYQLSFD